MVRVGSASADYAFEPVDASSIVPTATTAHMHEFLLYSLNVGYPVIAEGLEGAGKTTALRATAIKLGRFFVAYPCSRMYSVALFWIDLTRV